MKTDWGWGNKYSLRIKLQLIKLAKLENNLA